MIHPDATFWMAYRGDWRPYFLEFERRAVTPRRVRARLKNYPRYFACGWADLDHAGQLPLVLFVFETHDARGVVPAGRRRSPAAHLHLQPGDHRRPWRVTRGVALAAAQRPGPAAAAPAGRRLQECTFPFQAFPVGELRPNVISRVPTLSDPPGPDKWHFVAEPEPGPDHPAHRSSPVRQRPPGR